jgi:hypothetical protein
MPALNIQFGCDCRKTGAKYIDISHEKVTTKRHFISLIDTCLKIKINNNAFHYDETIFWALSADTD